MLIKVNELADDGVLGGQSLRADSDKGSASGTSAKSSLPQETHGTGKPLTLLRV